MTTDRHPICGRVSSIALVALFSCAAAFARSAETPAEKLDAIVKRYEEQQDKSHAAQRAAKTDAERLEALKLLPGKEYVVELRDLAMSARGTDTAASAWIWIVSIAGNVNDLPSRPAALDVLLSEYLQSPRLVDLPPKLRYADFAAGEAALRKMLDGSPHAPVKASALYTLAGIALGDSDTSPAKRDEAKELFSRLSVEFGEVPTTRGGTYGAVAERNLFEIDHLQVGMVAPDFEAVDENGVPFKLSDSRGKVVVVVFWGFW